MRNGAIVAESRACSCAGVHGVRGLTRLVRWQVGLPFCFVGCGLVVELGFVSAFHVQTFKAWVILVAPKPLAAHVREFVSVHEGVDKLIKVKVCQLPHNFQTARQRLQTVGKGSMVLHRRCTAWAHTFARVEYCLSS